MRDHALHNVEFGAYSDEPTAAGRLEAMYLAIGQLTQSMGMPDLQDAITLMATYAGPHNGIQLYGRLHTYLRPVAQAKFRGC